MDGDAGCGIVLLGLAGLILYVVVGAIAVVAVAAAAIIGVVAVIAVILAIHAVIAVILLSVMRNLFVHMWQDGWSEQFAVVLWRVLLPIVFVPLWITIWLNTLYPFVLAEPLQELLRNFGFYFNITPYVPVLAVISTVLVLGFYYGLYRKKEILPHYKGTVHYRWPQFLGAEVQIIATLKRWWIENFTKSRIRAYQAQKDIFGDSD